MYFTNDNWKRQAPLSNRESFMVMNTTDLKRESEASMVISNIRPCFKLLNTQNNNQTIALTFIKNNEQRPGQMQRQIN